VYTERELARTSLTKVKRTLGPYHPVLETRRLVCSVRSTTQPTKRPETLLSYLLDLGVCGLGWWRGAGDGGGGGCDGGGERSSPPLASSFAAAAMRGSSSSSRSTRYSSTCTPQSPPNQTKLGKQRLCMCSSEGM